MSSSEDRRRETFLMPTTAAVEHGEELLLKVLVGCGIDLDETPDDERQSLVSIGNALRFGDPELLGAVVGLLVAAYELAHEPGECVERQSED